MNHEQAEVTGWKRDPEKTRDPRAGAQKEQGPRKRERGPMRVAETDTEAKEQSAWLSRPHSPLPDGGLTVA